MQGEGTDDHLDAGVGFLTREDLGHILPLVIALVFLFLVLIVKRWCRFGVLKFRKIRNKGRQFALGNVAEGEGCTGKGSAVFVRYRSELGIVRDQLVVTTG